MRSPWEPLPDRLVSPPKSSANCCELRMTLRLLIKIVLGIIGFGFFAIAALLAYVLIVQKNYRKMPDTHDLRRQIYEMAGDYVTNHPHAGLVVALYQRGGSSLWGFGETSATNSDPPNG